MEEAVIKALTLRQPWASLVAEGVKTIETRSWCTSHRGRIAIHAGQRYHDGEWNLDLGRATHRICGGFERYPDALPRGAIIASAVLVDCVPIVDAGTSTTDAFVAINCSDDVRDDIAMLYRSDDSDGVRIDDELPLGYFEPGRYAWLLEAIATTTERCPWCWGKGVRIGRGFDGLDVAYEYACPVCDENGGCRPIDAKGRQLVWDWNPEKVKA
jgi:activating signal cointegrator 1